MRAQLVFLAPMAATMVIAAGVPKPSCLADIVLSLLKKPALQTAASSFCSSFIQPTTTTSITLTAATDTLTATETAAPPTTTATEIETTTAVATVTTTITTTAPMVRRDVLDERELPPILTAIAGFASSRISSACSCIITSPSPTVTKTKTVATTTATESTTVTLPPTTTIVVTITETETESSTTTLTSIVSNAPVDPCSGRPHQLCCMNVAPWSSNSGVWGGICGYTPPTPNELIGARCIPRTSTGCPAGTRSTCCSGLVPGQCALGTNCTP